MNDTPEIYEAHQDLAVCNTAFLDFVKKNPACMERANFNQILLTEQFTYSTPEPWPTFVSSKRKKEMSDIAMQINDLIKSIIPRFFSFDIQKISSYFEISPDVTKKLLYGVDADYLKKLLGRGDFIIDAHKEFKCLEFNMTSNLGGWQLDIIEPVYLSMPPIAKFIQEYKPKIIKSNFFSLFFAHLLDEVLQKNLNTGKPGGLTEVNMAIGYAGPPPMEVVLPLRNAYKGILKQKDPALKGDLFVCDLSALKISGKFLVYFNRKVNILLEMANGVVPFLFQQIVKDGNLSLYNGPVSRLMSNKFNLSFLWENQDSPLLSPEEQTVIKKHVPWTRKINAADIPYYYAQREKLVLKASEGLGGDEVFIGKNTPQADWEQKVQTAVENKSWVVQEYIPSACYLYQKGANSCLPHHVIWGFFVLGATPAGGFLRIMPEKDVKGVINAHQGAEVSSIIEVDES